MDQVSAKVSGSLDSLKLAEGGLGSVDMYCTCCNYHAYMHPIVIPIYIRRPNNIPPIRRPTPNSTTPSHTHPKPTHVGTSSDIELSVTFGGKGFKLDKRDAVTKVEADGEG